MNTVDSEMRQYFGEKRAVNLVNLPEKSKLGNETSNFHPLKI